MMLHRLRVTLICIGIAWACVLWVAADGAPSPIAVINVTQTQISHSEPRQGVERWVYQLYNRRITQAAIGYSTLRCEFVGAGGPLGSGISECFAVYALAKGKLTAHGILRSRSFYSLAVTGGTGIYADARGQVIANTFATKPRQERLLFGI